MYNPTGTQKRLTSYMLRKTNGMEKEPLGLDATSNVSFHYMNSNNESVYRRCNLLQGEGL